MPHPDDVLRVHPTPLSLAEWTVLAVVDEAPTHGFAIATATAPTGPVGKVWHIPRPIVYRALPRLEAQGLVATAELAAGRGPRRQIYEVTAPGTTAVALWLDEPVDHVRDVRSQLLVKLALRARRGLPAAPLASAQLDRFAGLTQSLTHPETDAPRQDEQAGFDQILRTWRRTTSEATIAFLSELAASPR